MIVKTRRLSKTSSFFGSTVLLVGIGSAAFALGSNEPSGCRPEAEPIVISSPVSDEPVLRFLALGDTGRGDRGQEAVAAAMTGFNLDFTAELVLLLGDNFYPRGVRATGDSQWKTKFEDMYDPARLDIPFYSVLGNHDYRRDEQVQIEYSRKNPQSRWKMPGRYYSFSRRLSDGTRIDFFGIDTNTITHDPAQLSWLDTALASSTAQWKIVFAHHVLYSYGHYGDNRTLIATLENRFVRGDVDLFVSGHEHQLQILEPIRAVSYMTSGAGSRPREAKCGERSVYAAGAPGFLGFEVSKNLLRTYVVLADGRVDFAYTMRK